MVLSSSVALLAVALMAAPAQQGSAQTQAEAPRAQVQGAQPPSGEPEQPARPSKRKRRTSRRQPAGSSQASFEQARASRDAGPTRQELTLAANVVGGYDDNVTAGLGTGSGAAPTAMASGTTASMDGTLGYFRGNRLHSIRMDGTGTLTAYPGYLDSPAAGGIANVAARTTLGRDLTLDVSERVGYEPLFSVYSAGASGAPQPGAGQPAAATGLFERRSLYSSSSVSVGNRWSRNDATSLSYAYRTQEFTGDDYGDSRSHSATAEYQRGLGHGVQARGEYRYGNTEYTDSQGALRPTVQHRIEAGPDVEKQLSRRRHLSFSLSAGAARVESVTAVALEPFSEWVPTGRVSLAFEPSADWSVQGGYRRDFSLFYGATDNVYKTDTAFVSTDGFVTERTALTLGGTYSNWQTLVGSGVHETLNVYGASAQVRVMLTDSVAATAGYYYYFHRYSDPGALPAGFPADYDRHAVRVGISLWFPLAGTVTPPRLNRR